jgi:hypothetical protein
MFRNLKRPLENIGTHSNPKKEVSWEKKTVILKNSVGSLPECEVMETLMEKEVI